jgi:hypothetical protein
VSYHFSDLEAVLENMLKEFFAAFAPGVTLKFFPQLPWFDEKH